MSNWRNLILVALCGLILVFPISAQQKDKVAVESGGSADVAKNSPADRSEPASGSKSDWGFFAPPASARSKPFPKATGQEKNTEPPGRLVPRYEFATAYNFADFSPGGSFNSFTSHGSTGSFAYNPSRWLGLTGEVGTYNFSRNVFPITGNNTSAKGGVVSFLFGPRLNLRKFDYFVPFAEFLIGGAQGDAQVTGAGHQNAFALATGGGVDLVLLKNLAWRVAQLDYLMTNFSGPALGASGRQNNFRVASGLVARFGIPNPPPPANHPPVAACSADPASIYAGSGDAVAVHVNASDPDNDPLTYSYSTTGGAVEGTGPEARWNSAGTAVGTYTVNVKVDDGRGGTASCAADIKVEERPNRPPTASLSVERSPILVGEHTAVACNGTDPDNDPLTYSFSASGGQITGTGSNAQFDSTGAQPGNYTVKCLVNDGRGGTAEASGNVEVKEPVQVKQLEAKLALHSIYFPTAQPTIAKPQGGLTVSQAATLDALANDFKQYLSYRPAAHLILEGHADIRGAKDYNEKLSERRVERAKSYLVEKGVPADHLETKAFGFEKNMTSEEVKKLLQSDPDLNPAERQKLIKNLLTVRLANNRRVDVTLSTTGEQSVRRFPFNSKDALTLLSRSGGEPAKTTSPPGKKPAAPVKKP